MAGKLPAPAAAQRSAALRSAIVGPALILAALASPWPAAVAPRSYAAARSHAAPAPLSVSPDGRPLALAFSSDFPAFVADAGHDRVWRTTYGDGRDTGLTSRTLSSNGELEVYVDPGLDARIGAPQLDPFSLGPSGALEITARPIPPALAPRLWGYRYASGAITTQPSFAQLYGYFEVRARLPAGKGLWPAIWLLPADMTWPPEIDIMESIGDPLTAYMSTHSKVDGAHTRKVALTGRGFHTFGLSWDAAQIVWYVDGAPVARRPTPADMHKPMYLLINLAVGGTWPGAPDASTVFPATYSIAWARAYRFKS